jgi:hypothetical protein
MQMYHHSSLQSFFTEWFPRNKEVEGCIMNIKNFRLHYKLGREWELGLVFSVEREDHCCKCEA